MKTIFLENSLSLTKKNKLTTTGEYLMAQQLKSSLLITTLCVLITYFIWGFDMAKSSLIGALIAIIPHFVFGRSAFKFAGASKMQQVVDSFYKGEKVKILLTAIMFALAFKFLSPVPVAFISVFCLVVITSLLTPIFLKL